jgi:hypothetical protein
MYAYKHITTQIHVNTQIQTHTHTHTHTHTQVHTALKDSHVETLEDTHSVVVGGVTYHFQEDQVAPCFKRLCESLFKHGK